MIPAQTPWRTDPEFNHEVILGADGLMVADCSIFHKKISATRCAANAAFIVRAANSHDALVCALEVIRAKVHAHNRGGELSAKLRASVRDICDEALKNKPAEVA